MGFSFLLFVRLGMLLVESVETFKLLDGRRQHLIAFKAIWSYISRGRITLINKEEQQNLPLSFWQLHHQATDIVFSSSIWCCSRIFQILWVSRGMNKSRVISVHNIFFCIFVIHLKDMRVHIKAASLIFQKQKLSFCTLFFPAEWWKTKERETERARNVTAGKKMICEH